MYTPLNQQVFVAAYSGALAGMGVSDRVVSDAVAADYANLALIAGAFAQAFDTAYGAGPASSLDLASIQMMCAGAWQDRSPTLSVETALPATYTGQCNALIAIIVAARAYFAGEAIPIPPAGGSSPTVYTPVFSNPTADASLGDGVYNGNFYTANGQLYINLFFAFGTTTTFGTSPLNVPFPPGFTLASVDVTKMLDAGGVPVAPGTFAGLVAGVIAATAAGALIMGTDFVQNWSSVPGFVTSDFGVIQLQIPLL